MRVVSWNETIYQQNSTVHGCLWKNKSLCNQLKEKGVRYDFFPVPSEITVKYQHSPKLHLLKKKLLKRTILVSSIQETQQKSDIFGEVKTYETFSKTQKEIQTKTLQVIWAQAMIQLDWAGYLTIHVKNKIFQMPIGNYGFQFLSNLIDFARRIAW